MPVTKECESAIAVMVAHSHYGRQRGDGIAELANAKHEHITGRARDCGRRGGRLASHSGAADIEGVVPATEINGVHQAGPTAKATMARKARVFIQQPLADRYAKAGLGAVQDGTR